MLWLLLEQRHQKLLHLELWRWGCKCFYHHKKSTYKPEHIPSLAFAGSSQSFPLTEHMFCRAAKTNCSSDSINQNFHLNSRDGSCLQACLAFGVLNQQKPHILGLESNSRHSSNPHIMFAFHTWEDFYSTFSPNWGPRLRSSSKKQNFYPEPGLAQAADARWPLCERQHTWYWFGRRTKAYGASL